MLTRQAIAHGYAILATLTPDQLRRAEDLLLEKRRNGPSDDYDEYIVRQVGRLISLSVCDSATVGDSANTEIGRL